MVLMAVKHRVKDYAAWKQVFDKFPPKAAGALFHRVNQAVGDPNDVLIVAGFASATAAQAFGSNPELKKAMEKAGVIGAPRIEMYEQIEVVEA